MGMCESRIFNKNKSNKNNIETNILKNKMNYDLQFTRYLYEKDEVKLSLIISILNKKEEAIFWAYELFYSGFIEELIELLWKIYYDFYATLNPSFENYLSIKFSSQLSIDKNDDKLLCMIINNFMIRPHNIDIFIMRQIITTVEIDNTCLKEYKLTNDFSKLENELFELIETRDYFMLTSLILYDLSNDNIINTFNYIINYFSKNSLKIEFKKELKNFKKLMNNYNPRIILLSRIVYYLSLLKKLNMGKNLYVHVDPEEVIMYETIHADLKFKEGTHQYILSARKILPIASIYHIDHDNYLSLFKLKRDINNNNIVEAYYYNWIYHASFSPIWKNRIKNYGGEIDVINKKVSFDNEDNEELFYEKFGYEPDEQKKNVQEKMIPKINVKRNWLSFYNEHKNNGIIEIDKEMFDELDKIIY